MIVPEADQAVPHAWQLAFGRGALEELPHPSVCGYAGRVFANQKLIGGQRAIRSHSAFEHDVAFAVGADLQVVAQADLRCHIDDRVVGGLAMDLREKDIRFFVRKETAAPDRRQLAGVGQDKDLSPEAEEALQWP